MIRVKKYRFRKILAVELLAFSCSLAYSDWQLNNACTQTTPPPVENIPVCYIGSGTTRRYFTSIESGLNAAVSGDIVIVIPPSDYETAPYIGDYTYPYGQSVNYNDFATQQVEYHISEPCVIKAGVSLVLPYDQTTANNASSNLTSYIETLETGIYPSKGNSRIYRTKDANGTKELAYNFLTNLSTSHKEIFLRTKVVVDEGVTITNNGNLIVSGMLSGGSGAGAYNGQTSYYYSELSLSKNAKIINNNQNANIYSYGYITETSRNNDSQIVNNKGTIYLPFILRDYRGVSSSYAIYDNSMDTTYKMTPFNQMEFRNIEPVIYNYYSGKLIGIANIHDALGEQDVDVCEKVNLIGNTSNYFIYLTNQNAYSTTKYNNSTQVIDADFYGGFTLTKVELSISVSVATMNLTTENAYFPLSYRFDVALHGLNGQNSVYDCTNQDVKVMTGATLHIDQDATVNIDRLINYSAFADRKIPTGLGNIQAGGSTYDNTKKGGKILVEGTLNANYLAGDIIVYDTSNISYTTDNITAYEFISFASEGILYTTSIRLYIKEKLQLTPYDTYSSKKPLYIGVNTYDTISSMIPNFDVITSGTTVGNNGTYNCSDGYQKVLYVNSGTTYSINLNNNVYTIYRNGSNTQLARNTSFNVNTYNLMNSIVSTNSISSNNNGVNEFDVQSFNVSSLSYPIPNTETYPLFVGKTISLTGKFDDSSKVYTKAITWSSNDTSIATVNANGVVTGVSAGEATITAKIDNFTQTFNVVCYEGSATDIDGFVAVTDSSSISASTTRLSSSGNVTFTLTVSPSSAWVNTITWDSGAATVTSTSTGTRNDYHTYSVTYTFPSQSGIRPDTYSNISATIVDYAGNSIKVIAPTITVTCFEKGTVIITARGKVKVEDINKNDLILSYNHFDGIFEFKPISAMIFHGNSTYQVIKLEFSDGNSIGFINSHGLFDVELNKYVDFTLDSYQDYIGHHFLRVENNTFKKVKLVDAYIEEKQTGSYTILSSENLNCVANDMLNITSVLHGIYNIFNYDKNYKYCEDEVIRDIEIYGLFTNDDFKDVINEKIFIDYGFKWFKISIGKGLFTMDTLQYYIEWLGSCIENGEAIIY